MGLAHALGGLIRAFSTEKLAAEDRRDGAPFFVFLLSVFGALFAWFLINEPWAEFLNAYSFGLLFGLVAFIHLRQPWVLPSNADLPESNAKIFSFTSEEQKIIEKQSFDILGNLQAALPVVPGRYSPRPVFQSYSCYTPALADLNKHHFDRSAPESLFLTRFPIDQRLWTMEDGKIFAEILATWEPVRQVGSLLWMCSPADSPKKSPPQTSTRHRGEFGKWQGLSPSKDIVFLRFLDLPPSLKSFPLISGESGYVIACRYSDGSERVYRLPPGIAKTGFVVSPLIQSFRDITLFRQTASSLADCVAFAIMPSRSEIAHGSYGFEVTERKPQRPSDTKNIAFLPIQKFRGNAPPELTWINGVEFLQFAGGSVASLLTEPVFVEALSLVVEFPKGSNASASLCVESLTGTERILWRSSGSGVANLHNISLAEGESLVLRTEGSGPTLVRDARLKLH
jgi:hypothetical protein